MTIFNKIKKQIIENNFFRPRWYSVFFNPYFIGRSTLYQQIKKFANKVSVEAKILDVGCGNRPYRSIFKSPFYEGIDIEGGGHVDKEKIVDKFFDGINIPYPDQQFDIIICTQVLEHPLDPKKLVKEMNRVLKTQGKVFITVPFVCNEHEIPYDFRRFTRYGLEQLLTENNFKITNLIPTTGISGVIGQMSSAFIFESLTFRSPMIKTILAVLILGPIQIISLFFDWLTGKCWITLDYVIIAKKRNV